MIAVDDLGALAVAMFNQSDAYAGRVLAAGADRVCGNTLAAAASRVNPSPATDVKQRWWTQDGRVRY